MQLVTTELDDPDAAPCGRCANCAGEIVSSDVDAVVVRDAIGFLRRSHLSIQPRRQGVVAGERSEEGKALSLWADAGWGSLVRDGKHAGRFHDDLVAAVADMVREWRPAPTPTWVTAVPSLRHPDLVPDFAQRVARALGIPFAAVLVKRRETAPQKTQENSHFEGSFLRPLRTLCVLCVRLSGFPSLHKLVHVVHSKPPELSLDILTGPAGQCHRRKVIDVRCSEPCRG